jgi:hypothetical protein
MWVDHFLVEAREIIVPLSLQVELKQHGDNLQVYWTDISRQGVFFFILQIRVTPGRARFDLGELLSFDTGTHSRCS